MKDPASGREQVLEPLAADEVFAPVPRPGQERLIDFDDHPVRQRRDVAARSVLVEILRVFFFNDQASPDV
jgi:hypothetical protein